MRSKDYTYSILRYRHSPFIGESLNLGLLVFFFDENQFYFRYPNKVNRIKSIYDDISERVISSYLKEIEQKIEIINVRLDDFFIDEIENSFDQFVDNFVLPTDSSALQFDQATTGLKNKNNSSKILKHLLKSYFQETSESKPDKEYELGKRFYNSVKNFVNEVGDSNQPNFYRDYKVQNSTGVEFNFKYAWKNGSLNLVKPLNFDLSEPRYIAKKAHENYGLFVDLERIAEKQTYRFDLLLGKPKDASLFKEYDHSLKLLDSIDKVKFIEENDLDKYTSNLIKSISK
ncbi:MAG: DUF3037 domain-containing protein [Bacteroidota bacterium]